MAHHSEELTDEMKKLVKEMQLGATKKFTDGKLNPQDEGEIKIAFGEENGRVVINFGKPVAWIGFTPEQAMELAAALMKHSNSAAEIEH